MQSDKKIENRTQEVSDMSRALKIMAKELNVPVICCSQLSRGTESQTNKRPMMSHLRESGSIEQDADIIIFLYRDEYYKNAEGDTVASDAEQNVAEIIVAKNRHGSTDTVKVGWTGRYTKFRDIAIEENTPH
jgi:replicative DNA helicase